MIIPCYNESDNIENLFNSIKQIQNEINFEVVIINNGSTDNSNTVIKKNKSKIKNFKLINIINNIGIGHAIKKGINESSSEIVCYTHADLQVDLKNCIKAYKIFRLSQTNEIFVKSFRKNRSFIEIFFSILMGFFNTLLFRKILYDIHSQPNLFKKLNKELIDKAPDNMAIDLYFYLYFKRKNFEIKRFDVNFIDRKNGVGSNDTFFQKIRYIPLAVKNSIKLFFDAK